MSDPSHEIKLHFLFLFSLQLTCLRASHCDVLSSPTPIPAERPEDVEFRPYRNFRGEEEFVLAPAEIGGKIKARCRSPGGGFGSMEIF